MNYFPPPNRRGDWGYRRLATSGVWRLGNAYSIYGHFWMSTSQDGSKFDAMVWISILGGTKTVAKKSGFQTEAEAIRYCEEAAGLYNMEGSAVFC